MFNPLRVFVCQFVGVVAAALLPVALVAFLSIPFALGGHPGETLPMATPFARHMT
jgi:hypothetical protein